MGTISDRTIDPPKKLSFTQPTMEELRSRALDFVKECKPKEYRLMVKAGDLDEYCQLKAESATRYAQILIEKGMMPEQAWNMAIRQRILESDSD